MFFPVIDDYEDDCAFSAFPLLPAGGGPTLLPPVPSPAWPQFNGTEEDVFCNRSARVEIRQCASGSEYLASIILEWVSLQCVNQTERDLRRGVDAEDVQLLQEVVAATISHQRTLERPSLIPLSVMFALIALIGILGNGLVLYIFGRKLAVTTSTHFVVALAVVDLLTCVLVIPGTAAQAWYAAFSSDALCKAWQLTRYAILFTPSLLLVAVAVERYVLICHPTSRTMMVSSRALRLALAGLFITGIALAVPPMLSAGTYALIRGTDVKIKVGICINNYMLISRGVLRHYWIAVSILYAVFTVALAVLYGLIFCNLYRRRHRWRPRLVQVQPTETCHIYESDSKENTTTKPNDDSDDVFLDGVRNTRNIGSRVMSGINIKSVSFWKKKGSQNQKGRRRRDTALGVPDRTLMFRQHSMFPAHVEQLNARRREILRRDFFMSRAEVAGILNEPCEPALHTKPVKLVPRESTITSVSSYVTESTELASDVTKGAVMTSAVCGNSVKKCQDSGNSPGASKSKSLSTAPQKPYFKSNPGPSRSRSEQSLSVPMRILRTKDKPIQIGITATGIKEAENSTSEKSGKNANPLKDAEQISPEIKATSADIEYIASIPERSVVNKTLTGMGSNVQADSLITPVDTKTISSNSENATNTSQGAQASLRPTSLSTAWPTHSPLTPIHRQRSTECLQRGTGWSSPHGKTAIIWLTVTVTFIAAYTPMLLIQTRVIPPFNNSRFLYFTYFFIAALNPLIYSVLNRSFTAALYRICTCHCQGCRG